ncbi:hypothetical protein HPT27_18945 [Permianibacter sp. IMCC34836]|uniref:hypothetical protein n=1 Tax=Permianibacter fluminis TaxID=2738515 RepID=UPI00155663C6|nr:hypothetical protein [Permianibacter fluminis]NQD39100.1 hypothetical protein [Permianibacter fluminis]
MKNVLGGLLLALCCSLVVFADETVDEFLDWAEDNGYSTYTNWADRPDEGTTDVVIAAVDDNGVVIQEGTFDSRTQRGNSYDSGESFSSWMRRWGFLRCGISCSDGDPNFSPR